MDKQKAALDIIAQAIPLTPFEGWNQRTLMKAALAAGYTSSDMIRVFPSDATDATEVLLKNYNRITLERLKEYHFETMKIRARIATAVRVKLEVMEHDREALRKIFAQMALPFNCVTSLRHLYETVDMMWYAAGDTSTDFNFYTKRLLLAGVYSSTLLHWMDDKSSGNQATWEFLDRRIENVMMIEKAKRSFKAKMQST